MGGDKKRVWSKIDALPMEIKDRVDEMLIDTSYTYLEIAIWLNEAGFEISKSAVGRYALRQNSARNRMLEAQEQAQALVKMVKKNPEIDYTEPTMQMLMAGLTQKIATAQEEFDAMPLDKAGRLIVALSRTKVYKEKAYQDMKDRAELAFEQLETELMTKIKADPGLASELKTILEKAKARMIEDAS